MFKCSFRVLVLGPSVFYSSASFTCSRCIRLWRLFMKDKYAEKLEEVLQGEPD